MKSWGDVALNAYCDCRSYVLDRWHHVALAVIAEYEARGRKLSDSDREVVSKMLLREEEP